MGSLTSWLLPLITATQSPQGVRVDAPRLLLPNALREQAFASPCTLVLERTLDGMLTLGNAGDCPLEIGVLATATVHHISFEGARGPGYSGLFHYAVPMATQRQDGGANPEHDGDLKAFTTPKATYAALPPREEIPMGAQGSCTLLVLVDGSEVGAVTPVSCPAELLAPSRRALSHWSFRQRLGGLQPLLLPVTFTYVSEEGYQSLPETLDPFGVTVQAADPSLCVFQVFRSAGEEVARDPLKCSTALWPQAQELAIPEAEFDEAWDKVVLRWDPQDGSITTAPRALPLSPDPSPSELLPLPLDLPDSENRACWVLHRVDDAGESAEMRPLDCPQVLYRAAQQAPKPTFRVFEHPGWASPRWTKLQVRFEGQPRLEQNPDRTVLRKYKLPELPDSREKVVCILVIEVDGTGRVTRFTSNASCPTDHRSAIAEVLFDWTFFPSRNDQGPQPSTFKLKLVFDEQ